MALDASTIAGLVLGVLGLFGMSMIYKFSKKIWKVLSSRLWPRRKGARLEEGLPMTSTTAQCASTLARSPASSAAGQEHQRNDHSRTTTSASPLAMGTPKNEPQSVTAEPRGTLRPSTLRATAVSRPSAPSTRNRHRGPMAPVLVPGAAVVPNASDLQPASPSIPAVIISETTADQPSGVPKVQPVMHKDTQEPTEGDLFHRSVPLVSSPPAAHSIKVVHPSSALERPSIHVKAADQDESPGPSQEDSVYTVAELVSIAPHHLNIGGSSSLNSAPVEPRVELAFPLESPQGAQKHTGEAQNERSSCNDAKPSIASSQLQPLLKSQASPNRTSSTPSNRLCENSTTTTNPTSSRTSAAGETSQSRVSDESGQEHALSLGDDQSQPRENTPAGDEGDPTERLTEVEAVAPNRGPTTGGEHIIIIGDNFPPLQLYVRFGDVITRAIRRNESTLRCTLPPASCAGIVKVTLSQAPSRISPEYGHSLAYFRYEDSRVVALCSQLQTVLERVDGRPLQDILTSLQQCLTTASQLGTDAKANSGPEHEQVPAHLRFQVDKLEDISIRFLSSYSNTTAWKNALSLQNQHGQTLAHISVMLGHHRLLSSLVEWGIDLSLTDSMGSTALHYAFLCNELACVVLLIRSGASELVLDELGRSPWDLNEPLADEVMSQLRGVPSVDGSFSASCRPIEEELDNETPEAAELIAKCLLVQLWLQQMKEGQHTKPTTNLAVEKNRVDLAQSGGMVPKVPLPTLYDRHTVLNLQSRKALIPNPEQGGTSPTVAALINDILGEGQLPLVPPINQDGADAEIVKLTKLPLPPLPHYSDPSRTLLKQPSVKDKGKFKVESFTAGAPPNSATPILYPSKRQSGHIFAQGPLGGEPSKGSELKHKKGSLLSPQSPDSKEAILPLNILGRQNQTTHPSSESRPPVRRAAHANRIPIVGLHLPESSFHLRTRPYRAVMSVMQKTDNNLSQLPKESSATPASGSGSGSTGAQQVLASQEQSKKGEKQEKSGPMYLNEFKQRKNENNTVRYEEYKCSGFTEAKPLYGCQAIVNEVLRGQSDNHPNRKAAKEAAAYQAAEALGLVEKVEKVEKMEKT